MNLCSNLSTVRVVGFLFVLVSFTNCKKEFNPKNPSQLSTESISQPVGGNTVTSASTLSQTKTANLFNCFGEAFLNLWYQEGTQYVIADDGSYAYSNKLSPSRGTLQLQLHDFRFEIPSAAKIESITVNARRFKTGKGSIKDYFAYLIKKHDLFPTGFASYGVRWSNPEQYPDAEAEASYFQNGSGNNGGSGNQAYTWTAEMINDLSFGVRINTYPPTGSSVVVYYDMVTITVHYTEPV